MSTADIGSESVCHWSRVRSRLPDVLLSDIQSVIVNYVTPTAFPSIVEIAEALTGLSIDDDTVKRRITINYLREHKHITDAVPETDILTIVRSELTAFVALMNERSSQEFWCIPVIFDAKHGHVFVTQWIMQRWFAKCKRLEDLPEWYRHCLQLSESCAGNELRLCTTMLESLPVLEQDDPEQDDPEQDDPEQDDPEQDDPEQDDPEQDDPEQSDSERDAEETTDGGGADALQDEAGLNVDGADTEL